MIGKTDLIQCNKKSVSTFTINGESFSKKRFAFLLQLVFLKWNILEIYLGSKYRSTMMTLNSCTDTRQITVARILASIWFYLFHFGKWWVLKQMDCALWCEIALLSATFAFSRKCNAVCGRDIIIPRQRDACYAMILFYQNWFFDSNSSFLLLR